MDQNAQSHRAVGDDEVSCNVHHIHKNGRSCSGAILAQASCLCVNSVETMVGARAATNRRLSDPEFGVFLHEVQGEPATTLLVVVAGCRPSGPLLEQELQVAEGFVRDDEL